VVEKRVGRYEIIDTLGKGAMGVVYLARDPIIDRQLAVKTLRVDLDTELADEFRERFLREARAAGRLNHPGIVTIHDVGEDARTGVVYIAMEYIKGTDLKRLLASGHRFRPSEAARIVAAVADGLDYAHATGVVHRDIKPANIILTADGTPKIMDFGVARLESSNLTVEGQFIGTPNYMSPEQVTGRMVDRRSDIFSLGVVLFELLTGQRPFSGETMHEVTLRIVQDPAPIPSSVNAELPPTFNPIVLKCLEKNPESRFQRGADVAKVLTALARSLTQRSPSDPGHTDVHLPDLETHVRAAPSATAPVPPQTAPAVVATQPPAIFRPSIRERIAEALPPVFLREVRMSWVLRIVGIWAAIWLIFGTFLALRRDTGPFPAPSVGSIRALNATAAAIRRADHALASGDAAAAEKAALEALDQVPTSRPARRVLADARVAIAAQRSSETTRLRVEELIANGRQMYREGSFATAEDVFREALELDPGNEIAVSFLDLAQERQRSLQRPSAPPTTRRRSTARGLTAPAPRPTPGTARVTVFFNSPINAGSLVVTLDEETLAQIPFDFTRRGVFGIKRRGSGQVKRVLLTPSGRHTLGIQLADTNRGSLGYRTFTEELDPGSDWTLRIDFPKGASKATFYLVRASGR